jgi:hypothetical protein
MFAEPGAPHHRPHFHAYHEDKTAIVAIDTIEVIAGGPSRRRERLVLAWATMHSLELMRDWERLQAGRPPFKIDPLRYVVVMSHSIHRVCSLEIVGPYILRVGFEDGVVRTIDLSAVLEGELFGPLRNRELFDQVRVDPEARTLVWPNGADFDPATLHDWPAAGKAMVDMARRWAADGD